MAEGARQLVEVDGRRMRLTNLDKVMYPETGMTKGEVISYYAEVAPVMVPLVAGRPVTRKRWVHGVGTPDAPQSAFFEKNFEHAPDWVRTAVIRHSDGPKTYPIAGDRATLVWLAQLAALELHVPQWRFDARGEPGNPDRMVFDLDPGEGMGLADCAEVARLVRDLVSRHGARGDAGHEREQGHPPLHGPGRAPDIRAGFAGRARAREGARGRPPRAHRVEHAQDPPRGPGAHRLEPEQRQEDDDRAVLPARALPSDGRGPANVGGARRPRPAPPRGARGARPRGIRRRPARGDHRSIARRPTRRVPLDAEDRGHPGADARVELGSALERRSRAS